MSNQPVDQHNTDDCSLEDYGSNPERRQLTEEVVEENAEEFVRHDNFYAGSCDDELPYLANTNNSEPSKRNYYDNSSTKMSVVPGRCVRGFLDVCVFILCIALVILQLGLLDYYYLTVLKEKVWYALLGADSLVIIILIWLLVVTVRNNQQQMEEVCSADAKVKYAWVGWFAYSIVLVAKISACFRLFYNELIPNAFDNRDKLFDDHLFRLGLSLSVLIYLFLLESHHYTPVFSNRQLYIVYLSTAVCLDLIDTIFFLDLLWQSLKDNWALPLWLDITILALSGFNFILPTFTLLRLRFGRFPRLLLVSDKIWALVYVLLVNGPYLGIRIYLYILLEVPQRGKQYDASIMVVKNVAMIYLAVKEVWTRLQYWRYKKRTTGSRGELTAAGVGNDDET